LLLRRISYALLSAAALAVVALIVRFNVLNLRAFFGGGAASQARSADAWIDRLSILIALDSVALLIVVCSLHLLFGRRRSQS
jgi:preprotein translocase subunit SecG